MVRSHFHGQEEEEGCQEGRQEEEGPRLSPPCREALRGDFGTDALATGARSRGPVGSVKRPIPSLRPSSGEQPSGSSTGCGRGVHAQTRKAGPGPWAPGPAGFNLRLQGHPCPLQPCRASARRPHSLYGGNAIPGHCCLAGPSPGGRTSGRPCSCAFWRAAFVQTKFCPGWRNVGLLGVAPADRAALMAERSQDGEARPASSDRRAGCPQGASGETAGATPSLRHPRRTARGERIRSTIP